MKKIKFSVFLGLLLFYTGTYNIIFASTNNYDKLIEKAIPNFDKIKDKLNNKNIAIENFTDVSGNTNNDCKIISKKLLTKLMSRYTNCKFIDRDDIDSVIKNKELALSGLVEQDKNTNKSLANINIIITGILINTKNSSELYIKLIDANTGVIISSFDVNYNSNISENIQDNEKIKSFKANPDVYYKINKTYKILMHLSEVNPAVFVLAVSTKRDKDLKNYPEARKKLKNIFRRIKSNPKRFRRLKIVHNNVKLIKAYDKEKYNKLQNLKIEILNKLNNEL